MIVKWEESEKELVVVQLRRIKKMIERKCDRRRVQIRKVKQMMKVNRELYQSSPVSYTGVEIGGIGVMLLRRSSVVKRSGGTAYK